MKLKFVIIIFTFLFTFSACKQCETCVPHVYANGLISPEVDPNGASVHLCDKRSIEGYESLTTLQDDVGDTLRFICR